jgi:hypothetical protein
VSSQGEVVGEWSRGGTTDVAWLVVATVQLGATAASPHTRALTHPCVSSARALRRDLNAASRAPREHNRPTVTRGDTEVPELQHECLPTQQRELTGRGGGGWAGRSLMEAYANCHDWFQGDETARVAYGALTTLLMVNTWLPFPGSLGNFNDDGWFVSTIVFCYLAFPTLLPYLQARSHCLSHTRTHWLLRRAAR